jgi:dienelactone hydrolase
LAAGYVVAPITYRSRDHDPQSRVSVEDCIAASEHLRKLPFVDSSSVVGYGCSGGGDLLLEMAAAGAKLCAIVPEEPATVLFTGVFNSGLPKNGALFTPADAAPISEDPKRYYTGKYKAITRAKIARIQCPILIVQGDVQPINRFNAEVLLPELRQAGKKFETKTYPGCPHCFAFAGNRKPVEALQAFKDAEEFCRRHVTTKPKSLDASLIREVPVV